MIESQMRFGEPPVINSAL